MTTKDKQERKMDIIDKTTRILAERVASKPGLVQMLNKHVGLFGGYSLGVESIKLKNGDIKIKVFPVFEEYKYAKFDD